MAISQAQKLAKAKYQQEKRSLIAAEVSKAKGEEYRAKAASLGLSLSMLIQRGIESYGTNHGGGEVIRQTPENQLSVADKKLVENFNALSPKSQKALREIISELVDKKSGD